MTPKETIEKFFAGTNFLVSGKPYHMQLPPDLAEWYVYTSDGGHSVLCLLDGVSTKGEEQWKQLCPVPVKTVLRGWRKEGDYIIATTGFKYDEQIGLQVDPADDER